MPNSPTRPPGPAAGAPAIGGLADAAARAAAVNPSINVVLEASAGTGKTRVLVDRYLNLISSGVDPRNILAITFTRKAAAEMRQRIVDQLRRAAELSPEAAARWRDLRDRLNEVGISTIDAFCLSLLREFPLEADLDPDFDVADETDLPRLIAESLDHALRIARGRARRDEDVALLFAQLGEARLRAGLASLLERRMVAADALRRVLASGPRDLTIAVACERASTRLAGALGGVTGGLEHLLETGPLGAARFAMLAADIRSLAAGTSISPTRLRSFIDRLRAHFFTKSGTPRKRVPGEYHAAHFATAAAKREHAGRLAEVALAIDDASKALSRDLNVIMSRAVWQVFTIALDRHRRTLESHGVLDFGELLARTTALIGQMDEFARSRYLLEARYHHVLVDEFQDTSRAQWDLVSQVVRAWGEGFGVAHEGKVPPSIFIVGDRKQSIYGFRDAEVTVLDEAARAIAGLRPGDQPVRTISHSFRSVPALLAFANDLFADVEKVSGRPDGFRYGESDAFPLEAPPPSTGEDSALGLIAHQDVRQCAAAVAGEIARLGRGAVIRDRQTGEHRPVRAGDIAILFRSRESHREFERALEALAIPTYVYKGLGFFDADEIKDCVALLRYLADPTSKLRAAALLRSRFIRLSDPGIQALAQGGLARALTAPDAQDRHDALDAEDTRVFGLVRASVPGWLALADRIPPAELLDRILADTAYGFELRGQRAVQARENVKKIRALVRKIQNNGYATLARLAEQIDRLSAGDESNAAIDAIDAVNLMTVHAAKGLEFPVVFVVNLSRGAGGPPPPIRIAPNEPGLDAVAVGDYRSEADEDAGERDQEEIKRLLYVAVTRARDRLYLASVVKNGTLSAGRGSLAGVMPGSCRSLFAEAAVDRGGTREIVWNAGSGRAHVFRRCDPVQPDEEVVAGLRDSGFVGPASGSSDLADDFDVLDAGDTPTRVAVTMLAATAGAAEPGRAGTPDADRVMAGRLVHRLFEAGARADGADTLAALARRLLTPEERLESDDAEALIASAVDVFGRMRGRPEVRGLLEGSTCLYEVPVSLRRDDRPGVVARGVIDCLVCLPDGGAVVLDFKTGSPRDSDRRQLDLYVEAARALFPGAAVRGQLVYP